MNTLCRRAFALLVIIFVPLLGYGQEQDRQMERVQVDGAELAYQVGGSLVGEPVLFIHGGVMADSFLRLMSEPELSGYRLINYHRRGYGQSADYEGLTSLQEQTNDALALLRHLRVEQVHIVAHSLGGPIAYGLAASAPEVVKSVLLLEGNLLQMEGFVPPADLVRPDARPPRPAASDDPRTAANAFMESLVGPDWRAELSPMFPGVAEQVTSDVIMTFVQDNPGIMQPVESGFYSQIRQPTSYVISEFRPPWTNVVEQLLPLVLPQAEFQYANGMGHEMQIVHAEAMAELIAKWLQRNPMK